VGDLAVRNRGTLGGSLAHADPSAELPAALVAAGGRVTVQSRRGEREVAAADLFQGFFVTGLAPDELLTRVIVPRARPGDGSAFEEWAPRAHDFADAGVAVRVQVDDTGCCVALGAAACGVAGTPVDLVEALTRAGVLGGSSDDDSLWAAVATRVAAACAGDDDRAELAGLLAARAVRRAFTRAGRIAAAA
jgi:carbon-monoxide dehydrogenase medium subunit